MRDKGERNSLRPSLAATVAVIAAWGAAAALLKVRAAQSAAYTSDLYDFHSALRSTVDGSFFRSYVYGSVLGDHSYLALLAVLPIYYLDSSRAFWALVVAAPIVMVCCLIAIRVVGGARHHPFPNLSTFILLAVPGMFWVMHEPVYGFHPDTLAAPLLLVAAIGFEGSRSRERDVGDTLAWIAFVVFLSLKEETALLGIVFAIPYLVRRQSRRLGIKLVTVSAVATVLGFLTIRFFRTPWNRGNETLIASVLDKISEPALGDGGSGWTVLVPALASLIVGIGVLAVRRRLSESDMAIGLVLSAKILALVLVFPSLPRTSWHLAIPVAAFAYGAYRGTQLLSNIDPRLRPRSAVGGVLILLILVYALDGRWYSEYARFLRERTVANEAQLAFDEFSPLVGDGVVSLPPYDMHAWRDHAAVAVPRGLFESPAGIADSFIAEEGELPADLTQMMTCFTPGPSSGPRSVYLRSGDCWYDDERADFDAVVGLP